MEYAESASSDDTIPVNSPIITEETPPKRKRTLDKRYKTIQAMLHSVGLGRYVLNFETKGVTPEEFLDLDDNQLKKLSIPKPARNKILRTKETGDWVPSLNNSLVLPYEEENLDKSQKLGEEHHHVPSDFRVEQHTRVPKEISVMLADKWEDSLDPSGWWVSEKLDGVRAYWNGKQLLSRNKIAFAAPKYFTEKLPKTVSLDGELWMGRNMFQNCISVVKRYKNSNEDDWQKIVYVLFDAPSIQGTFEKRLEYITNLAETIKSPMVRAHEHYVCTGKQHLERELKKVEELGGEGLMLRKPESEYEQRRSKNLLKVKSFKDAEATVIGHKEGTGRLQGLMGAIIVRNEQGVEFKIGSGFNDNQRRNPPKKGQKVTYKYMELTNKGVPRFPTFMRLHPGV